MAKVLLVGGGTGGHLEPLFVLMPHLRRGGFEVGLVSLERESTRQRCNKLGCRFFPITAGKFRRYFSLATTLEPLKLGIGYLQARRIIRQFSPDVIFSKGGFVSVPVVLAAASTPVVLHESDRVMGLSNRLLARRATRVLLGFGLAHPLAHPTELVGNPVDPAFRIRAVRARTPGRSPHPRILVVGGSQGAHALNELVFGSIRALLEWAEVIHLCGKRDRATAHALKAKLSSRERSRYFPIESTREMPTLLKKSSLYVGRSGAQMLSELAAAGVPAILIPLPGAASNHQYANASYFAARHGAYVLGQQHAKPEHLVEVVGHILGNATLHRRMHSAMRALDYPHAIVQIMRILRGLVGDRAISKAL